MQKKLIAAAVAGLIAVPALAQTNVTISGRVATGWESYKLSGGGFTGHDSESRVSDQSSRIIFNVNEDLGGGLKAWAQMDMRYGNDMGGIAMSGNTGAGFMGSWGKFTIGRWDVHYGELDGAIGGNRAGSLQTLVGNGVMSQVWNGAALATMGNGTRTPNLLMWDSPNWNGFTARLGYSTTGSGAATTEGNTNRANGDPGAGRSWTGAVRYNNGPWTAGLSYWNSNAESQVNGAAENDQRSTRAWVGYTFAMGLKLGFAWDRSSLDTGVNGGASFRAARNAWTIPVSYAWGPHKVYGQYARAGSHSGSAIAPGTGGRYKAHQWMLGYDYAFSKRTSAGVFYTKVNNASMAAYDMFGLGANGATATSGAGGEDSRQWYFGMAHNF